MSTLYLYGAAGAAFVIVCCYLVQPRKSRLPLPPGPKKLPLVGNLFDMPRTFEWLTYMEWSKKYNSDILHLDVAGTSIIVLSSTEATNELCEKRAALYSDRPRFPMLNELMGMDYLLAFMKYGEPQPTSLEFPALERCCTQEIAGSSSSSIQRMWPALFPRRAHRRLFHEAFNAAAVQRLRPRVREVCRKLLCDLLQKPDQNVVGHFRLMAAKVVMSVAYGIDVRSANDPYVKLAEKTVDKMVSAMAPGSFLVDSIPLLKYVPGWFPGAGFQRQAREGRRLAHEMMEKPFLVAKQQIVSGKAPHSFTMVGLRMAQESENKAYQEQLVQNTAATMWTAATDTTVSALATFILAILSNPEAQKKAQAEIDAVVGTDRLPDFDDEPHLPYVAALMKESMRWRNVAPIPIPRYLSVEDEYKGYRLPAGSIVIPNTWAMLHDENVYPDPYSFKPERYLLDGKLNPDIPGPDVNFGFGRRMCPGRHFALPSVWITMTSILAAFDVSKAVDDAGNVVEPSYEYCDGPIAMPLPFECSIKPRTQKASVLIEASVNKERRYTARADSGDGTAPL
ncbi:cytochrome P450 [Mycena pura]|uniref:Cytochrome P450 n=1 Tax=Mycena pura TaxID=153505 RepID=A0AAD6UMD4_9AGAR|nr:cytochrome P450 [Mycena pura]